jgi:hypothetical protein
LVCRHIRSSAVYSRSQIPGVIAQRIDEGLELVGRSELAVPGRQERVFICNNRWLFELFGPVAHEISHGLIRHALGIRRGTFLSSWVAEGYSDYVSHESSFPEEEGVRLLASGRENSSPAFRYFICRKVVQYLIEQRHFSFANIVAHAREFDALRTQMVADLKTHSPSPGQ